MSTTTIFVCQPIKWISHKAPIRRVREYMFDSGGATEIGLNIKNGKCAEIVRKF